jgi:hypothetical protein
MRVSYKNFEVKERGFTNELQVSQRRRAHQKDEPIYVCGK